jgi:serum/glucocorticoid-regulated kinase 2
MERLIIVACRLLAKKIQPPFKPSVVRRVLVSYHANPYDANFLQESVLDVANFDSEFTSEAPEDSVVADSKLSETVQEQFKGFTFNPNNEHLSESVGYPGVVG